MDLSYDDVQEILKIIDASSVEELHLEIGDLKPTRVGAGFRFSFAFTVDDVVPLKDLRKATVST